MVEKCNFDRQVLPHSYFLNFLQNLQEQRPSKAKSLVLSTTQELFRMLNIERPIAHQSSITFFFIRPA